VKATQLGIDGFAKLKPGDDMDNDMSATVAPGHNAQHQVLLNIERSKEQQLASDKSKMY